MLNIIKRLLCRHTHGRLIAIEFDGEAVYECTSCGKTVRKPL
jgi:transposase-like protein